MPAKKKVSKGKARKRNPLISRQVHGKGTEYTFQIKGKYPSRSIWTPFGTRSEAIWWPTAAERDHAYKAAQTAEFGPLRRDLLKKNPCGKAKKKNPAKRKAVARKPSKPSKRKRNGSEMESAAKMFKKFHGKQATKVKTVEQLRVTPSVLADCGKLVDLVVATDDGTGVRLTFNGGVRLGVTGNGGQLYFVGGDQAINLRQFPHVSPLKDQAELGEAVSICYSTSKDFHNFEKSDYEHEFGEEGGARPLVAYDVRSKRLYFVGGDYIVKRPGIID